MGGVMARHDAADEDKVWLLHSMLQLAVPLWAERVKHWTSERRRREAAEADGFLAEQGTALVWGVAKTKKHEHSYRGLNLSTRELFNRVACGIACAVVESGDPDWQRAFGPDRVGEGY